MLVCFLVLFMTGQSRASEIVVGVLAGVSGALEYTHYLFAITLI